MLNLLSKDVKIVCKKVEGTIFQHVDVCVFFKKNVGFLLFLNVDPFFIKC